MPDIINMRKSLAREVIDPLGEPTDNVFPNDYCQTPLYILTFIFMDICCSQPWLEFVLQLIVVNEEIHNYLKCLK